MELTAEQQEFVDHLREEMTVWASSRVIGSQVLRDLRERALTETLHKVDEVNASSREHRIMLFALMTGALVAVIDREVEDVRFSVKSEGMVMGLSCDIVLRRPIESVEIKATIEARR